MSYADCGPNVFLELNRGINSLKSCGDYTTSERTILNRLKEVLNTCENISVPSSNPEVDGRYFRDLLESKFSESENLKDYQAIINHLIALGTQAENQLLLTKKQLEKYKCLHLNEEQVIQLTEKGSLTGNEPNCLSTPKYLSKDIRDAVKIISQISFKYSPDLDLNSESLTKLYQRNELQPFNDLHLHLHKDDSKITNIDIQSKEDQQAAKQFTHAGICTISTQKADKAEMVIDRDIIISKDSEIISLKLEIDAKENEYRTLKEENVQLQMGIRKLQDTIKVLEFRKEQDLSDVEEMKMIVEETKEQAEAILLKKNALNEELHNLKRMLKNKTFRVNRVEQERDTLKKINREQDQKLKDQEQEQLKLLSIVDRSVQKYEMRKANIDKLKAELNEKDDIITKSKKQTENVENEIGYFLKDLMKAIVNNTINVKPFIKNCEFKSLNKNLQLVIDKISWSINRLISDKCKFEKDQSIIKDSIEQLKIQIEKQINDPVNGHSTIKKHLIELKSVLSKDKDCANVKVPLKNVVNELVSQIRLLDNEKAVQYNNIVHEASDTLHKLNTKLGELDAHKRFEKLLCIQVNDLVDALEQAEKVFAVLAPGEILNSKSLDVESKIFKIESSNEIIIDKVLPEIKGLSYRIKRFSEISTKLLREKEVTNWELKNKNERIDELETTVIELDSRMGKFGDQIKQYRQKLVDAEKNVNLKKEENQKLEDQFNEVSEKNLILEQELKLIEKEKEKVYKDCLIQEKKIDELTKDINKFKENVAELQHNCEVLSKENAKLRDEALSIDASFKECTIEYRNLSELYKADHEKHAKIIESLQTDINLRDDRLKDLKTAIEILKGQLDCSEKIKNSLQDSLIHEVEEEKDELKKKKILLEVQLENYEDTFCQIKENVKMLNEENDSLESLIKNLKEENELMNSCIIKASKSEETLSNKITELQRKISHLAKQADSHDTERDAIIQELKKELKLQKDRLRFQQDEIVLKEKEILEKNKKIDYQHKEIKKSEEKFKNRLKYELKQTQMKYKDKLQEIDKQYKKDEEEIIKSHNNSIQTLKAKYEELLNGPDVDQAFDPKKWLKTLSVKDLQLLHDQICKSSICVSSENESGIYDESKYYDRSSYGLQYKVSNEKNDTDCDVTSSDTGSYIGGRSFGSKRSSLDYDVTTDNDFYFDDECKKNLTAKQRESFIFQCGVQNRYTKKIISSNKIPFK